MGLELWPLKLLARTLEAVGPLARPPEELELPPSLAEGTPTIRSPLPSGRNLSPVSSPSCLPRTRRRTWRWTRKLGRNKMQKSRQKVKEKERENPRARKKL